MLQEPHKAVFEREHAPPRGESQDARQRAGVQAVVRGAKRKEGHEGDGRSGHFAYFDNVVV